MANAQERSYTVAGEVSFPKTGDLYVKLVTKEDYESDRDGPYRLVVKIGLGETEIGRAKFAFGGIPRGIYCMLCFQDVNGSGKLEKGVFGHKEPWGTYRPSRPALRAPRFDEIAFEVKGDVEGIALEIR